MRTGGHVVAAREGLVVRVEADFATVFLDGSGEHWRCRLRGRLRGTTGPVLVGDRVVVEAIGPGEGVIERIAPRGVTLTRPPLANVGGMLAVFTIREPAGSLELLDRRLVLAELHAISVVIVAHKADLLTEAERRRLGAWARYYPLVFTSVVSGEGLAELAARLTPGVWVLSGESGAGKSSLVQALVPTADVAAGSLSRIGRGRHTTRTVSLFRVGDAWLADTPGFQRLDLTGVDPRRIAAAFPEFAEWACRFDDCQHVTEPGCAVRAAVEQGAVDAARYAHYRRFLDEARRGARHPLP
jgi:ribosome biogenesis GTPase